MLHTCSSLGFGCTGVNYGCTCRTPGVTAPVLLLLRGCLLWLCWFLLQGGEMWVHLSHPWCDCRVTAGDKANILGGTRTVDAEGRTHTYIDHGNGMFVLHPDVLLSGA